MNNLYSRSPGNQGNGHHEDGRCPDEAGQTMVIIVFALIMLLAFVGIATDVGLAYIRSTRFSTAVDAAALAAIVDMSPAESLATPDARAHQFLASNGWPVDTIVTMESTRTQTVDGIPAYSLTVTWPVELFFMKIVGLDSIEIRRSADVAYYATADLYPPTPFERGQIRKASQFIVGPEGCTLHGDPVSPTRLSDNRVNPTYESTEGVYRYSIRIPGTYTVTHVDVELFDPDSHNAVGSGGTAQLSLGAGGGTTGYTCQSHNGGPCFARLNGENLQSANHNPFWFKRVDENLGPRSSCGQVVNPNANVTTVFDLYTLDLDGNRVDLGRYQDSNQNLAATDMKWVVPGPDIPATGSFQIQVDQLVPDNRGNRYLYLDVWATTGSGKNVWDLRAGPPKSWYVSEYGLMLASDVNERNLQLANNGALDLAMGVQVYAIGRMPTRHYPFTEVVNMPLAPILPIQSNGAVYLSTFDFIQSHSPPPVITVTVDTLSPSAPPPDGFISFIQVVSANPQDVAPNYQTTCELGTNCRDSWMRPYVGMGLPPIFFGGTMYASFMPYSDSHTWYIAITAGRPVIIR
jgi:hypothetical protein